MAGSGAIKRKSIQRRLREVRAAKAAPVQFAEPIPDWAMPLLANRERAVSILTLAWEDRDRAKEVTRVDYEAGLRELAPEIIEAGQADASWELFVKIREGQKVFAEQEAPATPPRTTTPVNTVDEVWRGEPGVNPCDR